MKHNKLACFTKKLLDIITLIGICSVYLGLIGFFFYSFYVMIYDLINSREDGLELAILFLTACGAILVIMGIGYLINRVYEWAKENC